MEIVYAGRLQEPSSIKRKVTLKLLKRELQLSFENKLIDKELRNRISNGLDEIEHLIKKDFKDSARNAVGELSNLLRKDTRSMRSGI